MSEKKVGIQWEVGLGGDGEVMGGKWRQMYFNNDKKKAKKKRVGIQLI